MYSYAAYAHTHDRIRCHVRTMMHTHTRTHTLLGVVTKITKPDGPSECAIKQWLNYEGFIDQAIAAARASGANLIFAKTTNHVCASKFVGDYATASADFSSDDSRIKERTHNQCTASLLKDFGGPTAEIGQIKDLTPAAAENYCTNGVFDNSGSGYLNDRLLKHIFATNTNAARDRNGSGAHVVLFNDSAVQSCEYTEVGDGRHYHPLNTVRVRMLGNLITAGS